jgi:hypothetical protein
MKFRRLVHTLLAVYALVCVCSIVAIAAKSHCPQLSIFFNALSALFMANIEVGLGQSVEVK